MNVNVKKRALTSVLFAVAALAGFRAVAEEKGADAAPKEAASPEQAFVDVARVLQSPRCVNCHPNGDAPLQGDNGALHGMNITRDIERVGMTCQTCHRETAVNPSAANMPPAVKNWHLPPKTTPMIFQGRTPAELCKQLKDPAHNGNHDLAALLKHVSHDDLVLYGWNPGAGRTLPPLSHDVFVARFKQWVDAGGPCPE